MWSSPLSTHQSNSVQCHPAFQVLVAAPFREYRSIQSMVMTMKSGPKSEMSGNAQRGIQPSSPQKGFSLYPPSRNQHSHVELHRLPVCAGKELDIVKMWKCQSQVPQNQHLILSATVKAHYGWKQILSDSKRFPSTRRKLDSWITRGEGEECYHRKKPLVGM